jgi:virginiamycin B lyase
MDKYVRNMIISVVVVATVTYLSLNNLFANNIFFNSLINADKLFDRLFPPTKEDGILSDRSVVTPVAEKDKKYVCGDSMANSNDYITEFVIPFPCSQPVGLTVDKNNNIWIAANWIGRFLVFDSSTNTFVKNISIPNWNPETMFGSMMWDLKFDKNGDLWFTDEQSSSVWKYFVKQDKFERYKSPTNFSYPLSLTFDSNGLVWFTNVFGKKLGILNPEEVRNNTTMGIREIDLGKWINFETMGPSSMGFSPNDKNKTNSLLERDVSNLNAAVNFNDTGEKEDTDIMWFSTVEFPYGGQIVKFNMQTENFTIYDLNKTKSLPISIAQDHEGRVWTNDHASNLFLVLDPKTNQVKQYATSPASTRNTTTLPYYNQYYDGKIWFNEHEGNAIAQYDIKNKTLIEYHIPTRNIAWGNTSNPLKFTIDNNGSVWFTEWTENKIGRISKENMNNIPISLSTSKDKVIIDSKANIGDSVDVFVSQNKSTTVGNMSSSNGYEPSSKMSSFDNLSDKPFNITMFATSSIAKNGQLWNLTSNFDKRTFSVSDLPISSLLPLKTTLYIDPTETVVPGNYTLTVSARYNNEITYSKIIDFYVS